MNTITIKRPINFKKCEACGHYKKSVKNTINLTAAFLGSIDYSMLCADCNPNK